MELRKTEHSVPFIVLSRSTHTERFEPTAAVRKAWSRHQIYWLLQIAGWGAVAFREIINYTFFIVHEFMWSIVATFCISSLYGIIITHGFRWWIRQRDTFARGLKHVLILALTSSVVLAFVLGLCSLSIGFIIGSDKAWGFVNLPYYLALSMNWIPVTTAWVVIYFLIHMLEHSNEINQFRMQAENSARNAELELLKRQLNPHFLFNALNSIKALVLIDTAKAREAIVKLSELLRFSLNYEKHTLITLTDELAEVEKYLRLECIRFGERLVYRLEDEDHCGDVLLPPATVLTLTENAVKHGISLLPKGGSIHVKASRHEAYCTVEVVNTGTLTQRASGGLGLRYVREQLESLLEEPTLQLYDNGDQSVSALLRFKIKTAYHDDTDSTGRR